jgi:eukaryotic-like serine/threonine-protein kinase
VIRENGRGGMALVYVSVRADDTFRKRVAIKLVKRVVELSTTFRVVFATNDRHSHRSITPNIVKLLDGGATQDGSPW